MIENGCSFRDVEIYNVYSELQTRDDIQRSQFLEQLDQTLKDLADGKKAKDFEENPATTLRKHLPVILRLSYDVPFPDVRETCARIIQELEDKGVKVPRRRYAGPSSFISSKELIPVETDDEEVYLHFADAFICNGRVTNAKRLMSFHPLYLDSFMNTESFVMDGEGPLPFDWRYYIGILAAARHQSSYLVNICENEFLLKNGDPMWLNGIDHAPKKLQNLMDLNKILAHKPWLISLEHIQDLLKGPSADTWSVAELVHAIAIMVHYHCLAAFVYGCGINPEVDLDGGHTFVTPTVSDSSSNAEPTTPTSTVVNAFNDVHREQNSTQTLLERMKKVEKDHEQEEETSQEEVLRQFHSIQNKELDDSKEITAVPDVAPTLDRYRKDRAFRYEDFAKREKNGNISPFRAQDFSWHKHGYSLIDRLYPGIGSLLDSKFKAIINLTYKTMGDTTDVDTTTFRLATWNYIHLIFGIFHDDYRYDEVNQLLYRPYKEYIKMDDEIFILIEMDGEIVHLRHFSEDFDHIIET
eukprot:gene17557-9187_t